ncbi:hypothetical protein Tco_1038031 [Tanacetum coccineum]
MLLLLVQGKLTNLSLDDRYALNVALRMYTRRIVIQERVEDLQLAVESYQKKINLTRPDTTRPDLRKMTPYTGYPDVQGIIYQDELSRNRLMRTDELHKFSDGTLNHVRTTLNDIATGIQMDYLPKRRWSPQDKRRARVMISAIDRKLRDRRLMRNLEKFVGGRPKLKDGGEASLSVIRTALTVSFAAAKYTISSSFSIGAVSIGSSAISCFICLNASYASVFQWKSLFFVHFFKVLKNGSDFSADLAKNLFRLASFPFNFCTSFRHFGDGRLSTTSTLSGHTFSPLELTLYPKNIPSSTPKAMLSQCVWDTSISAGLSMPQKSKLRWSSPHNLLRPSSVRVEPIITVCSGYSGFIAILTLSSIIGLVADEVSSGPETTAHSSGTNLLLFRAAHRLKQCSYKISEADPPSTYIRCTQWPPISASMIIGPSVPSSSPRGGNKISGLGEKLCVILCLATLSQDATAFLLLAFPQSVSSGAYIRLCYALLYHETRRILHGSVSQPGFSSVAEL